MGTPHKWAEVIKAWADGEEVQWRNRDRWETWISRTTCPAFVPDEEWRIKPAPLRYRVALMKDNAGKPWSCLAQFPTEYQRGLERDADFVRWLTDWQEVEV